MMKDATVLSLLVLFVILVFILAPFFTLFAINTISEEASFGWKIPHNIWTYISIWILQIVWTSKTSGS